MEARMTNPAMVLGAMEPFQALFKAVYAGGVDPATLELVHLRASQINGCSACVDSGARSARKAGETEEPLATVAAWREAPYFSDAERAALALAEAATRLADRPDPVPDQVWDAAAAHYDEKGMAAIVLMIAVTNLFNRLNATTPQAPRQPDVLSSCPVTRPGRAHQLQPGCPGPSAPVPHAASPGRLPQLRAVAPVRRSRECRRNGLPGRGLVSRFWRRSG
jgi:AhpD family alkylhydroperoxidase